MIIPDLSLQLIELTCGHCGHQKQLAREGLSDSQLYELESRPCEECGNKGMVIVLNPHASAPRFNPEQTP